MGNNNKSILIAVMSGLTLCILCVAVVFLFPTGDKESYVPDYYEAGDYDEEYYDDEYYDDEYYDEDYFVDDDDEYNDEYYEDYNDYEFAEDID